MLGQEILGQHQVIDQLNTVVEQYGGIKGYAMVLNIWPDELYKIVRGKRPPSRKILEALGLEKVTVYRKKSSKKVLTKS